MSEIPERVLGAAIAVSHANAHREAVRGMIKATMDGALGPDRLVVAGPHEQEIAERLEDAAERLCRAEGSDWTDEVTRDHICCEGRQWLAALGLLPKGSE